MLRTVRLLTAGLYILAAIPLGYAIALGLPLGYLKTFLLGRLFGSAVLKILGFKLHIQGAEHLGAHHPCLYICNHQSNLDLFIGAKLLPRHCIGVGKKSIAWIPLFGQLFAISGNFLIERHNRRKSLATMDAMAQKIVGDKLGLWLFPEGTRSRGRGLLPFKKGAFHTAIKIQCPLVPVVIAPYRAKFGHFGVRTLQVRVLPPVSTRGLGEGDISPLRDTCFKLFQGEMARLEGA